MIVRRPGPSGPEGRPGSLSTRKRPSSGATCVIGSSRPNRPSSSNVNAATVVMGFVSDAILKIVSRVTGRSRPTSRRPVAISRIGCPGRQASATTPASSPLAMWSCSVVSKGEVAAERVNMMCRLFYILSIKSSHGNRRS